MAKKRKVRKKKVAQRAPSKLKFVVEVALTFDNTVTKGAVASFVQYAIDQLRSDFRDPGGLNRVRVRKVDFD